MQAEVISIGDELTSGQRLDTNSQWLSQQLSELGIRTVRHTTVGDDLAANIDALRLAVERVDFVVCTGGLGPTLDDLTRQAMAEAFDRPLKLDEAALQGIEEMFRRRNREMPASNRVQAMFPAGSHIIPNPHGSAPGVDLVVAGAGKSSRIFALPGVPVEMKQMWRDTVAPRIDMALDVKLGRLRHYSLKLFGIGESDVEVKLPDLIDRRRTPTVGITVSRATITLRIASRASSDVEFARLIEPTVLEIRSALGDLIFGEQEDELEHAVLRLLASRKLTMASVEVGAASWVSDWMLKAAAQDDCNYAGGVAFPTIQFSRRWLSSQPMQNSDAEMHCGEPHKQVWETLARQTQERFHANIGLALGCYPTTQDMETSAAPFTCCFAIAIGDQVTFQQRSMGGHPDVLGPRMAKTGLDLLRLQLKD